MIFSDNKIMICMLDVLCQLYCTDKMWCDFVVCTRKDMHVERIHRDRKWWGTQLAKLRKFYFTALLPELACPRFRYGDIREPLDLKVIIMSSLQTVVVAYLCPRPGKRRNSCTLHLKVGL